MVRAVFDVEPPYQRRSVWDEKRASLYIESLLLGCPVPAITLAETDPTQAGHQYIVIDGKQRLTSLKRFAIDKSLRLTGLETLTELNGKGYDETSALPEFSRFANLPIRTVVMKNWNRSEVLQFVFHRLNSQVTPLSTHELRRALLGGPFNEFLDVRSAESTMIQRILGISEPDFRLRDAELLLRAVAFAGFFEKYKGNLKQFLDTTTRTLNKSWGGAGPQVATQLCDEAEAAIATTYEIFGQDSFQRFEAGSYTGRFNRAVFDAMVMVFRMSDVRIAAIGHEHAIRNAFELLMADPDFDRLTVATTKRRDAVEQRITRWATAVGAATGLPNLAERAIEGLDAK
jgi:hypothetical protein